MARRASGPLRRALSALGGACLAGLLASGLPAIALEEPGSGKPRGASSEPAPGAPTVDLDRLLKLPDSIDYKVDRRAGSTRAEWQQLFEEARAAIVAAREEFEVLQGELVEVASESSNWKIAPPGAGTSQSDAPLDFQLRQRIQRQRAEVERAETRLNDLTIEANLAGVPDDWRGE